MRSALLAAVCCFAILAAAASQESPNLPPIETQQAAEVVLSEPNICNVDCLCESRDCDPCECQGPKTEARDERPIIYYFTADWCLPCRDLKPLVDQLKAEGHRIHPMDVAAEKNARYVRYYDINSVPQFVAVDITGRELGRTQPGETRVSEILATVAQPARATGARQPVISEPAYHVPPPQQTGRLLFRRGVARSVCGPGGCR